ncbi:MAG: hypothetical protein GWO24_29555, partial [Akkermansiaceae bacterium]|nr:hypothetical protein [Akkermansiaceae bacterium]
WWSWTPSVSGRYYVSLDGSDFTTLLAVYTGSAVDSLSLLSRYPNLNVPTASIRERFYRDSRVEFNAVAGTTYRIAVDGAGGDFGSVALRIGSTSLRLDPLAELLPAGSEWDYLLLVDANNQPIDPESVDEDFDTTWHTAASYDGPAFAAASPGLLGYGSISADPVVTDIWDGLDHDGDLLPDDAPPEGLRFTTYFRTTFTPAFSVAHLGFEGLIDDGAVVYVNGREVARMNLHGAKDANEWTTRANTNSAEDAPQIGFALDQNLPAGQPVELALSLHNASSGSSDLGLDLRVYSVARPDLVTPPNDSFANATVLVGDPPFVETGSTEDPVFGLAATKEPGEPNHAGRSGGGSIWWRWVPATSGRVAVSLAGSDFDTLLAVYTGGSVDALTPVSRYPHLMVPASSDEEPFHEGSRVEFDAVAGTAYYLAVDGDRAEFGPVELAINSVTTRLDPVAELLPARSDWEYLLLVDEGNQPVDPEDLDEDFDATWHTAASYDGPAFSGPARGLFGYGNINSGEIVTDIWGGRDHDGDSVPDDLPPAGERFTTYYRSTFTPEEAIAHLAFEGLIDDGAIIYLNGREVTRLNVGGGEDAEAWKTRAQGNDNNGVNNENAPQVGFALDQNLPAGEAVEIAVSLHNSSSSSSDMGFDLRVYSVNPPPPSRTSILIVRATAQSGQYEISWESAPNAVYDLEFSESLEPGSWLTIVSGIPAAAGGVNSIFHIPGVPRGFYRVLQTR